MEAERVCDICMNAPRAVRFHPCGHSVACELCALQLIAKCPGSSEAETLFCPHCKAPITHIEKDRPGARTPLRRQSTFVPSAFDPLSVVGHAMTAETADPEAAGATSGVLAFIDSLKGSTDKETQAAAEAASKTWATGTLPDAAAATPAYVAQLLRMQQQASVPPHPVVRAISGVLAVSFLGVFAWGMHAILAIRADFGAYLHSEDFSVQVTRVDTLQGPLNALVPPSYDPAALAALPAPTSHQQWWALMSDAAARSADTQDIELARDCVLWLVGLQVAASLLKPLLAVARNRPDMLKTLSTGLDLMIGMAILGALYPMYWDAEQGLVMLMYVPGWAVLWSLVWMATTSAACVTFAYRAMRPHNRANPWSRENCVLGCLATGSCCYGLWFLYVPLLCYALYFAQEYAELVTAQACDAEFVATLPFHGASAAALYLPIRVASRLGIYAWIAGVLLLPQLNARLMSPQTPPAAPSAAQPAAAAGGAAALV